MNLLRNLKISLKLSILIGVSAIALLGVGYTGYHYLKFASEGSESMYENQMVPNGFISQLSTNNRKMDAYVLELMLTTDGKRNKELEEKLANTLQEQEKLFNQLEKINLSQKAHEKLDTYKQAKLAEELQEVIMKFKI